MTEDRAVELINEWLNLAKEVGDMVRQFGAVDLVR